MSIAAAGPAQIPEDNSLLTLRFDDGSIGTVGYFAQGAPSMPKEELQVIGAERSGVLENFTGVTLYAGRRKTHKRCRGKGQEEEVAAFFKAVAAGCPAISLDSLLATTLACIKAVDSLRSGQPERIELAELADERAP